MEAPDELRTAVWQVLRRAYVRLLAPREGKRPELLTEAEASLLIDPHLDALQHDFSALCLTLAEAHRRGAEHVHGVMHSLPGMDVDDHTLLDDAVEWASTAAAEGLDD